MVMVITHDTNNMHPYCNCNYIEYYFELVIELKLSIFGDIVCLWEVTCTRVLRAHVLHGSNDVWMWSDAPRMNLHENITESAC